MTASNDGRAPDNGPQPDANPFFAEAARELMGAVMSSLNSTHPGRWDLADVVHILESRDLIAQVLARTPDTQSKHRFMDEERTRANFAASDTKE